MITRAIGRPTPTVPPIIIATAKSKPAPCHDMSLLLLGSLKLRIHHLAHRANSAVLLSVFDQINQHQDETASSTAMAKGLRRISMLIVRRVIPSQTAGERGPVRKPRRSMVNRVVTASGDQAHGPVPACFGG